MATKRKSIIEEALLEAKSLEDALKANTKEILATHMKQEIESIVESSLKEEDEEFEIDIEGSDENEDGMPDDDVVTGDDSEELINLDAFTADEEGEAELELDLDLDLPDDGEESDIDVLELPMDLLGGDEIDLTGAPDDEVLKVFKAMSDDDEVEVIKDEGGIHLTDNETGAEYYIKESMEELDGMAEGCDKSLEEDCEALEEETIYEIEMDEDQGYDDKEDESLGMRTGKELEEEESYSDRREDSYGKWGDRDDESLEEDHTLARTKGYQRKGGHRNRQEESRKPRKPISERRNSRKPISERRKTPKNVSKVADSKIMKEYKELKSKNEEYKGALNVFKDKLNEVALFNTNLAYVNRLFTEHSTTKKEKMSILKRFDEADSVKGSKSIYKTIKSELDRKSPITESVEKKVNRTVKSSASDLNESTAYVDPQIVAIKDLMKRIS
tara:strand:- start:553 stop:1884 length:1332 start_codon:yes stop_codon:yes gene_type:complete